MKTVFSLFLIFRTYFFLSFVLFSGFRTSFPEIATVFRISSEISFCCSLFSYLPQAFQKQIFAFLPKIPTLPGPLWFHWPFLRASPGVGAWRRELQVWIKFLWKNWGNYRGDIKLNVYSSFIKEIKKLSSFKIRLIRFIKRYQESMLIFSPPQ